MSCPGDTIHLKPVGCYMPTFHLFFLLCKKVDVYWVMIGGIPIFKSIWTIIHLVIHPISLKKVAKYSLLRQMKYDRSKPTKKPLLALQLF